MQYTTISHSFERAVRDDSGKYRIYKTPKGERLPSITTILSKTVSSSKEFGLNKWRSDEGEAAFHITELAKIYGSKTHKAIEDTLYNKEPDLRSGMVREHYNRFLPYLQNINNISGIEIPLYSDKMKVAGTADCVAEYNGVLSIIDYKTKRKPQLESYLIEPFIQTTAYAKMFEELTSLPVKQIVILVSDERGGSMDMIKSPDDYEDKLNDKIEQYYNQLG